MNAEQEIVKPYLDKLKENISFLDTYDDIEVEDEFGNTNRTKYVDFYEVMETIDDLLSGEKTMTREKAIHNLKYLFFNAKALLNTEEALSMAVEALEKEPILDKIRAEIMQLDYDTESIDYDSNDMPQTETVHTICREEVLQIIDKYKSEE